MKYHTGIKMHLKQQSPSNYVVHTHNNTTCKCEINVKATNQYGSL